LPKTTAIALLHPALHTTGSREAKPTAAKPLQLHSQNLVQGECKPSLLEFAEPPPRFNEVTLNSDIEVCGVCASLREFITSSGVWKSFGVGWGVESKIFCIFVKIT